MKWLASFSKKGVDARVILIDAPSPVNHVALPDALLDSVINLDGYSRGSKIGQFVKAQFRLNSRMLEEYNPLSTKDPFPLMTMLRSRESYSVPGVSDIPNWLQNRSDPREAVSGWEDLVKSNIRVRDIPGHHFQPFHPSNVSILWEMRTLIRC